MAKHQFGELIHRLRAVLVCNKEDTRSDAVLLERYVKDRDQDAFTALVARHCQAVWGVCLGFFRDSPDAEDVFQATFLRLARKADSIRYSDNSIRGWLCRVASRTALDVRRSNARQYKLRQRFARRTPREEPEAGVDRSRVWDLVVEEMAHLPDRFREPLERSLLRGLSSREAAAELGCSHVAVQQRIERGQVLLRERLEKRGVMLTAGSTMLAAFAVPAASAMPPLDLLTRTAESAIAYAAGQTVPGTAAVLAGGAGLAVKGKLLLVAAVLLAAGAVGGVVWALLPTDSHKSTIPLAYRGPSWADRPAGRDISGDQARIEGWVLGPDRRRIANADVVVLGHQVYQPGELSLRGEVLARGQTNAQGHFAIDLPGAPANGVYRVWAVAPGLAPMTFEHVGHPTGRLLEFHLLRPESIRGIVQDEAGEPIAGAVVSPSQIAWTSMEQAPGQPDDESLPGWPASVTTGEDGSFELTGVNLKSLVSVRVDDGRHVPQRLTLDRARWSGRICTIQLKEARSLEGRVLAADTGKPLSGARLSVVDAADPGIISAAVALTDDAGNFHLNPNPSEHYRLTILPPDGTPYLGISKPITCPAEHNDKLDIELPRGVLLSGRVTDKDTGKPLARVRARFVSAREAGQPGGQTILERSAATKVDGRFQLVIENEPGHLVFQERSGDYTIEQLPVRADAIAATPALSGNHVGKIEPGHDMANRQYDAVVRRGVRIDGEIIGPNGALVAEGMWMCPSLSSPRGEAAPGWPHRFDGGHFTLRGCTPGRTYTVLFVDAKNNLGACAELRADAPGKPVRIKLQQCGEASVRIRNDLGEPIARLGTDLRILTPAAVAGDRESADRAREMRQAPFEEWSNRLGMTPATDEMGFVVFSSLIPGVRYRLKDASMAGGEAVEFELSAGQSLVLPDVFRKRP